MEHVRIDEGVKRGPRVMPAPPVRRISSVPANNSKLATLNSQEVIQRYFNDETTADIAESLGVHRSALHQWLLRNCEQDWRDAQVARAITANEQAKEDLDTAADALSLARAREKLRSAQWELERVFARMYGQHVQVDVSIDISTAIAQLSERLKQKVIEGELSTDRTAIAAPQHENNNEVIDVEPHE